MSYKQANSDHFAQYLNTIALIPRLSADEEKQLFLSGNRQQVVYYHLSYIPGMVRNYVTETATFEELVQQGNLALAQAAERFDVMQEVRFITYAHYYVEKLVKEFITDARHPVKMRMNKAFRRILGSWRNIGVVPPLTGDEKKDIAEALSVSISDVDRFVSWRYTPYLAIFSYDDESDMIGVDDLEDTDMDIMSWMVNQNIDGIINEAIAKLPPRLARILQDRTFADRSTAKRLDRLGREMNLSAERVRQLERNAIEKLKEILGEKMLNELAAA